jgi:hypothetical protein
MQCDRPYSCEEDSQITCYLLRELNAGMTYVYTVEIFDCLQSA